MIGGASADDARRGRVLCVVAAGRRIADPSDAFGREARTRLAGTSGLSSAGIELALTQHLEQSPSVDDLERLLARVGLTTRCHSVLASNVCTAALRCLAVAVATARTVFVRPSRRDPALATLLVSALRGQSAFAEAGGCVQIVDDVRPTAGDEVHLYGSDAALTAIAAHFPPEVLVRAHGAGMGVALVGPRANPTPAAEAVARDIIPFDQRGCLSPRAVLVDGPADHVMAVASALHNALERTAVPRGPVDEDTRGRIALYRTAMDAVGHVLSGRDHVVGIDLTPRALPSSPAARVAHVVRADSTTARELLAPWADYIAAIGSDEVGALCTGVVALAPTARLSHLGEMQRPPLDGPVDLRLQRRARGGTWSRERG